MSLVGLPILAGACVWIAIATHLWVLIWPAAVLVAVAVVYALRLPRAFGKRADGSLPWYAWLAWWPWFFYMWFAHELARRATREPVANLVAPGVWVGRRPRPGELPAGVAIVVDLCAEFPKAAGLGDARYLAIPTLDATSPTPDEIAHAVELVLAAGGDAFIHCAFGHGRSATVAAAVLVRRGDATLDDVEATMKAKRPRIGLNGIQRAALAAAIER